MQRLEVRGAVRPIYRSLGVKRLTGVTSIQWPNLQPPCAKAANGYLTECFCCGVNNNVFLKCNRLCRQVSRHYKLFIFCLPACAGSSRIP